MQIRTANHNPCGFLWHPLQTSLHVPGCERDVTHSISRFLDVEVENGNDGLRLIRIGANSPLKQLKATGNVGLHGIMEMGDRIVAINGILTNNIPDVGVLSRGRSSWEIAVFDHRTRRTVSWTLPIHAASPL